MQHIVELRHWAGPGVELSFKRDIQNISTRVGAGITTNNSGNNRYFLARAGPQRAVELDISGKDLLAYGWYPT